jgi:hypothetical protein
LERAKAHSKSGRQTQRTPPVDYRAGLEEVAMQASELVMFVVMTHYQIPVYKVAGVRH